MNPTINRFLRVSAYIMLIVSFFMLLPLIVSVVCEETHSIFAFIFCMVIFTLIATLLLFITKKTPGNIYTRDSIIILGLCWFLASFIGAVPYLLSGTLTNPFDAFFESCSGFTTTGATVFTDVRPLDYGILMWRSLTQWIGALALLVFALAIIPSLFTDGASISSTDKPGMALTRSFNKNFQIIKNIISAYLCITLAEIFLLLSTGVNIFDSVICVLGTISTGGFSNYNEGVMHFTNPTVRLLLVIFMLMCGQSISVFYSSIRKSINAFRINTEAKLFWLIIILAVVINIVYLTLWKDGFDIEDISKTIFQVVSVVTTTGYAACNYALWPYFSLAILVLLMIIGGCSMSVSSGNKIIRIAILIKLLVHGIETRLHPNAVTPVRINNVDLQAETVNSVVNHTFLFVFAFFSGAFILTWENVDLTQCFTDSISLLCNVGMSYTHTGFIDNIASYHGITKLALSILMIAGRLELYNILVLFTPSFWRAE